MESIEGDDDNKPSRTYQVGWFSMVSPHTAIKRQADTHFQ